MEMPSSVSDPRRRWPTDDYDATTLLGIKMLGNAILNRTVLWRGVVLINDFTVLAPTFVGVTGIARFSCL